MLGETLDAAPIALAELGDSLCSLRLCGPDAVRQMRVSLGRHGQLTAVATYRAATGALEVLDGFKRLRAARELGLGTLRAHVVADDATTAKVALWLLNDGAGLSELEQAWLIRSLYRDDALNQPQIGHLFGRHKSWVCRRLLLAEALDETLQADVRLGLLAARTACILSRLPRGNQRAAADVVVRRGLTVQQAQTLVWTLLECPDDRARAAVLDRELERTTPLAAAPRNRDRTPAEWILSDTGAVTRLCGRLQARLCEAPIAALGVEAAALVRAALSDLVPILGALRRRIEHSTGKDPSHVSLEHTRGSGLAGRDARPLGDERTRDLSHPPGQPKHGAQDPHGALRGPDRAAPGAPGAVPASPSGEPAQSVP